MEGVLLWEGGGWTSQHQSDVDLFHQEGNGSAAPATEAMAAPGLACGGRPFSHPALRKPVLERQACRQHPDSCPRREHFPPRCSEELCFLRRQFLSRKKKKRLFAIPVLTELPGRLSSRGHTAPCPWTPPRRAMAVLSTLQPDH